MDATSCRSHLAVEDDDPALGEKFSTATLRNDGTAGPIPSTVHGAPSTAAESREVLARLKRMAGFESQDFDPAVCPWCLHICTPTAYQTWLPVPIEIFLPLVQQLWHG